MCEFGIGGVCYCGPFVAYGGESKLNVSSCNDDCEDEHHGIISIGHLAPATEYVFSASFVAASGDEFDIDDVLVASTSSPTIPGRVAFLSIVERSEDYLEVQWSAVDDDGGAKITKYQVFVNGFLVQETADGDTYSAALEGGEHLPDCTITVCAVNALGVGPQSNRLRSVLRDSGLLMAPRSLKPLQVSSGSITFATQNISTNASGSATAPTLIVQHRESVGQAFINSVMRRSSNGTQVTVYKLQHDTSYVFRTFLVSSAGVTSAFSSSVVVHTGKPRAPEKTPTPLVSHVTGECACFVSIRMFSAWYL